jgi:hypothetical protein
VAREKRRLSQVFIYFLYVGGSLQFLAGMENEYSEFNPLVTTIPGMSLGRAGSGWASKKPDSKNCCPGRAEFFLCRPGPSGQNIVGPSGRAGPFLNLPKLLPRPDPTCLSGQISLPRPDPLGQNKRSGWAIFGPSHFRAGPGQAIGPDCPCSGLVATHSGYDHRSLCCQQP